MKSSEAMILAGFIAQLVRASHLYRVVTGSNHIEILTPVVQTMDSAIYRINHYPADQH